MRRWKYLVILAVLAQSPAWAAEAPAAAPQDQAQKPAEKKDQRSPAAEAERLKIYDEIEVTDRAPDMIGVADSATEGVTGRQDLERRPILRPGELLETVP